MASKKQVVIDKDRYEELVAKEEIFDSVFPWPGELRVDTQDLKSTARLVRKYENALPSRLVDEYVPPKEPPAQPKPARGKRT